MAKKDKILYKENDVVDFIGSVCYKSSVSKKSTPCSPGVVTIKRVLPNTVHPYLITAPEDSESTANGWVNAKDVRALDSLEEEPATILEIEEMEEGAASAPQGEQESGSTKNLSPIAQNTLSKPQLKYSKDKPPLSCIMTHSSCYIQTREMKPIGILWHSTGANNTDLSRYVQPSKDDPNYEKLIDQIGLNTYGNDYNHSPRRDGVNAWIGKLANGTIASVQTLPWSYRSWGCGVGEKGSCNDYWIQIEICEDDLTDPTYFHYVFEEACELTAYLCKKFKINPSGVVEYNKVIVPTILCHAEAAELKLATNKVDVNHWLQRYNKTMDQMREKIAYLVDDNFISNELKDTTILYLDPTYSQIEVGDQVKLDNDATYESGKPVEKWMYKTRLYVGQILKNAIELVSSEGKIYGRISKKYVIKKRED